MTITSTHNERLKEIRKLLASRRARERGGRFVAEGEDLLAAADAAGWEPIERFCAAGSGLPGTAVEPRVLAGISSLASGTRALAVYDERWAQAPAGPLCVCLHGLRDPGNIGAVLRSAQAFGADSVALTGASADPFAPKAVRASMGAVFGVPICRVSDLAELPRPRIALVADRGRPLRELGLARASLIVGAERDGLPAEVVETADEVARIPIHSHSLNAAMAATIALYEATRMAR